MSALPCPRCGKPLGRVRVVVDGNWACQRCVYDLERGARAAPARVNGVKQVETLSPVEPYGRGSAPTA